MPQDATAENILDYEVREGCYSWLDNCLERFEGKEARQEYYARLAQEASRF